MATRMRTVGAMTAAMWVMSVAVTAGADDGGSSTSAVSTPMTPRPPLHWYGYQTLAVDAVFDAAYFIGTNVKFSESGFVTAIGVFFPLFTGLTVHDIHNRPGGVLAASFILRLVVPLVVGVATMRAVPSSCSSVVDSDNDVSACPFAVFPSYTGFTSGYGGGMVAAQVVDDLALSWEPVTKNVESAPATSGLTWAPKMGGVRTVEGNTVTTFGVGGTF